MDGSILIILAFIGFMCVVTLTGDKTVQVEFNGNTLHVSEGDTLNYVGPESKDTLKVYFVK